METFKAPVPVEYSNQLVLLTAQLAKYYGCSVEHIRDNFRKNRGRFVEGKHYFKIEGEDLKAFRDYTENFRLVETEDDGMFPVVPARTPSLYLWTERGAARHAKMLSTDKAWDVFEELRESYFSKNDFASAPPSQPQEEGGSTENPIQIFEHEQFGKIRVVVIDGEPFPVGIDVATALGYTNPQKALRDHVPDKYKRTERIVHPQGGTQNTTLINEAGMYRLILRSKLPAAEEFTDWVCEVIVTIRKTGSYSVAPEPAQLKSSKRSEGQKSPAFVYVLLMSNNLVLLTKLGQSKNIRKRIAQIKRETGLTVKDIYFTPLMPRDKARFIEGLCKEKFSAQRIKGEFFSAKFDDVCEAVNRFMEMAFATVPQSQVSNFERAEKILDVANMMADSSEKQRLLISAGKFFADEKFS